MCAREQAKAWALREVWHDTKTSKYGMLPWIASRLRKNIAGKPSGGSPTKGSLVEFLQKIDADPEWYPGKHVGGTQGPKRTLRGAKVNAIASAAKRLKTQRDEPAYSRIVAACPNAAINPKTKQPVDKKLIYNVFRET